MQGGPYTTTLNQGLAGNATIRGMRAFESLELLSPCACRNSEIRSPPSHWSGTPQRWRGLVPGEISATATPPLFSPAHAPRDRSGHAPRLLPNIELHKIFFLFFFPSERFLYGNMLAKSLKLEKSKALDDSIAWGWPPASSTTPRSRSYPTTASPRHALTRPDPGAIFTNGVPVRAARTHPALTP